MAESEVFTTACQALEASSILDKLEARGTIRLALKSSGLEARSVDPEQMKVILERVLPGELEARGVDNGEAVCASIAGAISGLSVSGAANTPEAIFARLGG